MEACVSYVFLFTCAWIFLHTFCILAHFIKTSKYIHQPINAIIQQEFCLNKVLKEAMKTQEKSLHFTLVLEYNWVEGSVN